MKVLIIDDSPDALALAEARLAREAVTTISADGGKVGLAMAKEEAPDLILLDVDMPDMSGFEVCRALKADVDLSMIPVIFLSGSSDAQDKVYGLDMGAIDYVTKPFDAFELRARVRVALRTKHLQDLLTRYARIDALTELSNRRALMDRLVQEWSRFQRHGEDLSLIIADVDRFKDINDTWGHSTGDEVLRQVARVFAEESRDGDLPARYGGDEFIVLCPGVNAAEAVELATRCQARIHQITFEKGPQSVGVTMSFGVADAHDKASLEAIVTAADEALYKSKRAGRDTITVEQMLPVAH